MAGCVAPPHTGTTRFPEKLAGIGTEPFWSVTIHGNSFGYRDPDTPQARTTAIERRQEGERLIVTGELDGRALRGVLVREQCSDGMSDRRYPYSLELAFGERTLNGCGY